MNKLSLAPYTRVVVNSNGISFGFGSTHRYLEKKYQNAALEICDLLKNNPCKEIDLYNTLEEKYAASDIKIVLNALSDGKHLIEADTYKKSDRFSRCKLYYNISGDDPEETQQKLKTKNVLILGCGGIGNLVSMSLATSGIGKLYLLDDDDIEISNLSRQFSFSEQDIGKNKIDILSDFLSKRNSDIEIKQIKRKIKEKHELNSVLPKNLDLIILSADSPSDIIYWVNEYCVNNKVAYINIGYVDDYPYFGPFYIPGETACFDCTNIITKNEVDDSFAKEKLHKINKTYQAPSVSFINMIASGMALSDIYMYLGGYGDPVSKNNRCFYVPSEFFLKKIPFNINKECHCCGGK